MEGLIGAAIGIITMAIFLALPAGLGVAVAIAIASCSVRRAGATETPEWANSPRVPVELTSFNPPA